MLHRFVRSSSLPTLRTKLFPWSCRSNSSIIDRNVCTCCGSAQTSSLVLPFPFSSPYRTLTMSTAPATHDATISSPLPSNASSSSSSTSASAIHPWISKPNAIVKSTNFTATNIVGKPEDTDIVFYHGSNCPDGYMASFAAWRRLTFLEKKTNVQYIPLEHNGANYDALLGSLPDITDKQIVFVDYCLPRNIMEILQAKCKTLVVLDHHASAEKNMQGFPDANRSVYFEMEQSGATLAWNYFFPATEVPLLFRYIEDKDIWRWAFTDSEAFSAGFGTVKFDYEILNKVLENGEQSIKDIIGKGKAILEYKNSVRDSHVKRASVCRLKLAPQFKALIVNGSTQASEIGNAMCQVPGIQMGIIWNYDGTKKSVYVSLRSDSDEVDVSIIAKQMGGGGHKRAAGFTYNNINIEELLVQETVGTVNEGSSTNNRE